MKDLPAREKIDIVEKVAQYLVLAGALDKSSPLEDYERANELSLELAMLLPAPLYRSVAEAGTHPTEGLNPATVALMVRQTLFTTEGEEQPVMLAVHVPGLSDKTPRSKAHH
ncbi:hypothetical protein [Azohydromonas lata]|uniref:Uncharacterized protein n=1 Tax=Azohydromonas lata TaxID=45677 RepID=A0ABU5IQ76_9BURK|nr:hypothetical protein [Azohydromonas lata]MDZ5461052.1 hypothetical protein [Azohydromonas lata]